MKSLSLSLLTAAAAVSLVSTVFAADLPVYRKAPPAPIPFYSWTGFYGGIYGGGDFSNDPIAGVKPTSPDLAYNNLANGGIGQVSNLINPGGTNCVGLVNCNVGGAATTSITNLVNPGFQTNSSPTNSSQAAGLIGVELGYRRQFDHWVLGIGTDISAFSHGGSTNSQGSFFNTNRVTATSQATICIAATPGTCTNPQLITTTGSTGTTNSGSSITSFAMNPNWIGTVRA